MVPIMIGTKILKRVGVSLFQGTKKLKIALLKESLRDYRRDVSMCQQLGQPNAEKVGILTQRITAVLVTQKDGRQEGKGIDHFFKADKKRELCQNR